MYLAKKISYVIFLYYLIIVFTCLSNCSLGQNLVNVPKISAYVTDQTGTLADQERQNLENKLQKLEETKGSQVIILIIPSTYPEDIEQFGIRVADTLKIGRKGIDDG